MILILSYFINNTCNVNTFVEKEKINFLCEDNDDYDDYDDYSNNICCDKYINTNYNLTKNTCYPYYTTNYTNILLQCEEEVDYKDLFVIEDFVLISLIVYLLIGLYLLIKYYNKKKMYNKINKVDGGELHHLIN